MENLIRYFNSKIELSNQELEFLLEHAEVKSFSKNSLLLREGEISRAFYFIERGCVRLFYLSDHEEKTAYFYFENMFVSSYESFTKQIPAKHNLVTVEDSTLVIFDAETVFKFLNFSPKFESLARIVMEEELSIYQNIISSFITQNAEQRYLNLLRDQPQLIKRIPQHQIATFLGVSPETLSRIRKRIVHK